MSVSLLCKSTTTAENIQLFVHKKQKQKQKNTIVHGIRLVKVSSYPYAKLVLETIPNVNVDIYN